MMLLTESEAAERLRKSVHTVRRLRAAGKLTYLPGRPILIDEADLSAYIEASKLGKDSASQGAVGSTPEIQKIAEARAWAQRKRLLKTIRAGGGPNRR